MDFNTFVNTYRGNGGYGSGSGDNGECVGLINFGEIQMRGLKYPLQGITYARDMLNANNTRPDIYEKVVNISSASQVPSKGDIIVWSNKGDTRGHVAYVWDAPSGSNNLQVFDQWQGAQAQIRTYSYNTCLGWWHIKVNQGDGMAEKITLDTDRILAHGILGRNGKAGRANALAGGSDNWVNQDLTNKFIQDFFLSAEGRQWRDSMDANSFNEMQRRYDALPVLQKQLADVQTALANEKAKPPVEVIKEVTKIVEVPAIVDEKAVVQNVFLRFWNSLFKK